MDLGGAALRGSLVGLLYMGWVVAPSVADMAGMYGSSRWHVWFFKVTTMDGGGCSASAGLRLECYPVVMIARTV